MIDVDPEIGAGLDGMVPGSDDSAPDWGDVLARAAVRESSYRTWARRLVVPAIGLAIGGGIAAVVFAHSPSTTSGGAGSCKAIARYHGADYTGEGVGVAPVAAGPAGTAVVPECNDQPGATTGAQTVRVLRIRGISPEIAFIQEGLQEAIFVRGSLAAHPPAAVRRLLHAPSCRRADAPIRLAARWDGVLAANGRTELDWRPPYDLEIFVKRASAARYVRAFLTVRVPASLGRPLGKTDFQHPLQITASCAGGRYVAESVRTIPPR